MALVGKTQGTNQTAPTSGAKTNERKAINIFADGAPTGKLSKLNPEEDAWVSTGPPPKGVYSLQLFVGDGESKGVYQNDNKKGEFESYSINFMVKVVNSEEQYEGSIGFGTVTTRIGRGKELSTAAGLFLKMGHKIDPNKEYSDLKIAQLVVKAVERSPILHGNECDWKASYQDVNGKWQTVANTMDEFPVDDEGNHLWKFSITTREGGRQEVSAKFVVKKWGGKELVKTETVEEVVEEAKPVVKANGKIAPKKKEPETVVEEEIEVSEEDEELMLT